MRLPGFVLSAINVFQIVKGAGVLLTINEVAQMFSVSRVTIWRWNKEVPDFPKAIKIGGSTRWRKSDLEKYIAKRAQERADDA